VVSSDCSGGTATFAIRNEGTANLTTSLITWTNVNAVGCSATPTYDSGATIVAGNTSYVTFTNCTSQRQHTWRLIGPSNTVIVTVFCP